jgi:hypothetical protein
MCLFHGLDLGRQDRNAGDGSRCLQEKEKELRHGAALVLLFMSCLEALPRPHGVRDEVLTGKMMLRLKLLIRASPVASLSRKK